MEDETAILRSSVDRLAYLEAIAVAVEECA